MAFQPVVQSRRSLVQLTTAFSVFMSLRFDIHVGVPRSGSSTESRQRSKADEQSTVADGRLLKRNPFCSADSTPLKGPQLFLIRTVRRMVQTSLLRWNRRPFDVRRTEYGGPMYFPPCCRVNPLFHPFYELSLERTMRIDIAKGF